MTKELWHADIKIDITTAKLCIESQFHAISPLFDIVCIDEGWDNVVYLVNGTLIFRFPRRKIAVPLIERENQLLPNLKGMFELDIPCPEYMGQASQQYPYPFQGYKKILGETSYEHVLSEQDRIESIKPLSLFLRQLHAIKKNQAYEKGARTQVFDRTRKEKLFFDLQERIEKIKQKNIAQLDDNKINQIFALAADADISRSSQCLVHGDLYFRHLLFNEGKLSGVIDWGDAGINHPVIDLGVVHSFYPQSCHDDFFQYYGEVDKGCWDYARFLGMYSALTIMLYAYDREKALWIEEAKKSLGFMMGG